MNNDFTTLGIDPVSVHHDLMIEIGRVEMALDQALECDDGLDDLEVERLSNKRAKLDNALAKLACR